MKKRRGAPRLTDAAEKWVLTHFENLNAGLEYVLEAFPVLHRRALVETAPRFEDAELMLILDVFNGVALTPQIAGQHLAMQVDDGCALDRLDRKYAIDRDALYKKLKALPPFQAAAWELWASAYWHAGHWEAKTPEQYIQILRS